MQKFIDVVLNVPLNQVFTYKEPESDPDYEGTNIFGRRIEVRFGNRKLNGYVVAYYDSLPSTCAVTIDKIRPATRYLSKEQILTPELYSIAKWMSDYYICSIGECVSAMVPSGKRESNISALPLLEEGDSFEKKTLSDEQKNAVRGIMDSEKPFHYLYGKTGSGKTEVFLSCAEEILAQGKSVIYLVPEIGLTPQVTEAVIKRFGNTAAVLHSALTPSQRLTEWNKILRQECKIIIGARSAVFAPCPNLGLIIIDEEHDSSYKSGSSPRYHARQVAMYRCTQKKIPLLMGSATPSVEAWQSMDTGLIQRHCLTKRLAGGAMPHIKTINLSLNPSDSCLSSELVKEINSTLEEKRQTILFLNRRGFTHFFKCNSCSYEMKCKNCSVSMTFHKNINRLKCHYCGYNIQPPTQCPECGSLDVGYFGFGTEFIEAEVKSKFPNAKVIRIDTDNLHHKNELQEKLDDFKNGKYDILLGTQMVAKGLNFPNLKLVGVVLADTSLHLPDFRASERTFSLITQVAGRAGRFFPDGKVLVQSYSPDRDPINYAVNNMTEEFYEKEIQMRQILGFPPFSRLLRLVFRSQVPGKAMVAAKGAAGILKLKGDNSVDILGPSECPLEMINGNQRYQIILRGKKISSLQKMAGCLIREYAPPKDVYIEVDVDPMSLL